MLSETPRLTLKLLGGASIEGPDGPLAGRASQRHRLALLAVLAAAPRGTSRDKVIALLWPERDALRARHALSDSIYRVNQALGQEAVVASGNRDLWLDDDVLPSDLASFRRAVDSRRWELAAETYSGPFLDGFHLSGAAEFEDWMAEERRLLARGYAEVLESLADERARTGALDAALEAWQRRAALDPFDARIAMRLMEAMEAQGNPAAALQHAKIHALLLEQEFDAGPDPDVTALAERIRSTPATPRPVVDGSAGDSVRDTATVILAAAGSDSDRDATVILAAADSDDDLDPMPGIAAPSEPRLAPVGKNRRRPFGAITLIAATIAIVVVALAGLRVLGLISFPTNIRFGDSTAAAAIVPNATGAAETPSIAVLAFQDLSDDGDRVRFADGVAEEITNSLERTDGLRVLARRSSFAFRDRPLDVRQIAGVLGVDYVVDGSYRSSADSVWITAQLVDGRSGFLIWSRTFPTNPSSERLYSIQNEIAGRVAAELSLRFRADADTAYADPDGPAYDAYLEGVYSLHKFQEAVHTRQPDTIRYAIERFQWVTKEMPGWAPGWAALGEAYHWAAYYGVEPAKHRIASKRALEQALELDPDHPQANASYGYVLHRLDHDAEGAEAFLRRAVQLDSEQYWHCGYPLFLLWTGRYDEAVRATAMAQVSDPAYWPYEVLLAMTYRCAGQFENAVQHAERAMTMAPQATFAYRELALALERSGRPEDALSILDSAKVTNSYLDLVRALVLARNGREADAEAILRRTDARRTDEWAVQYWAARTMTAPPLRAAILIALGRPDEAIAELEAGVMRDADALLYDRCYPELQAMETDARYRELLARIGVPE